MASRGCPLIVGHRLLSVVASLAVECRLYVPGGSSCSSRALGHTGSVVVAQGISCSTARGIFPDQGSNSHPLLRQADSLPLTHQRSPHCGFLVLHVWSVTRTTRTARDRLDISVFFLPLPLFSIFLLSLWPAQDSSQHGLSPRTRTVAPSPLSAPLEPNSGHTLHISQVITWL